MSRGLGISLAVALVTAMVAFPLLVPSWTPKATIAIGWLELLCAVVVGAALAPNQAAEVLWRVLGVMVFLTFVGYLVAMLVAGGGRITWTKSSQASVVSAIAGLIMIGVPCLRMAFKRTKEENPESSEDIDDSEDDAAEDTE